MNNTTLGQTNPTGARRRRAFGRTNPRRRKLWALESKVLGAPFHGVVPELVAVVVEHEVGIFRYRETEELVELAFQLAGSPARISEGDEDLCRALMMGDVAQNLGAAGHREASIDLHGIGAAIVERVKHKAELGLHRTAGEDAHAARHCRILLACCLEQSRE